MWSWLVGLQLLWLVFFGIPDGHVRIVVLSIRDEAYFVWFQEMRLHSFDICNHCEEATDIMIYPSLPCGNSSVSEHISSHDFEPYTESFILRFFFDSVMNFLYRLIDAYVPVIGV